ncbi:MAG: tRNA pseudouridine(55) synthase TruB [Peptococcaceae bacterium]|nr:tRNA pseudouridine(55) synthase TruB [Peptococcaceae bacterium]
MDGVLNVLKPPGMTSHDVVDYIRRTAGIKKAGHTGTLDPGASGVLVVCLGRATRLARYLPGDDKEYRAEMTLGVTTATADSFGAVLDRRDASAVTGEQLRLALATFTGAIEQVPPMTSAVKHRGRKLYELARAGVEVERPARTVTIRSLRFIRGDGWGTKEPRVFIHVTCSKGTYIRTLCEDIGRRLGCGAFMSFLVRTRDGACTIEDAVTLEEIRAAALEGALAGLVTGMDDALGRYPAVRVRSGAAAAVCSGANLYPPGVEEAPPGLSPGTLVRLKGRQGLLALAESRLDPENNTRIYFKPVCVLARD